MASQTLVVLTDDIDALDDVETEAEYTVQFVFEATTYEIDLSSEHLDAYNELMQPFVAAARRVSRSRRGPRQATPDHDVKLVREWAKENGYEVSDRGRIPASIYEAYESGTKAPEAKSKSRKDHAEA